MYAYRFSGKRYDCGSKLGYLQATVEYALGHPALGKDFRRYLNGLDVNAAEFREDEARAAQANANANGRARASRRPLAGNGSGSGRETHGRAAKEGQVQGSGRGNGSGGRRKSGRSAPL